MSAVVVRILGLSSGTACAFDGLWLTEYDPTRPGISPDGFPMTAHVAATADRSQALRLPDAAAAHRLWTMSSGSTRPDGRPDRPLTGFHLMFEPADDDSGPSDELEGR